MIGKEVKIKLILTDKAIFGELTDLGPLTGMLHYKEISFQKTSEELKKYKKNDIINC